MTEDDTFLKLKRMPFDEAWNMYYRWAILNPYTEGNASNMFLEPYGWTLEELSNEYYRRNTNVRRQT